MLYIKYTTTCCIYNIPPYVVYIKYAKGEVLENSSNMLKYMKF